MNHKALVVIDIQNDITEHYRDIMDRLNAAIEWAAESGVEIAQFLYPKTEYDLCIDSSNKSPAALAEEIVRSLT
jgi:hypothetical protein